MTDFEAYVREAETYLGRLTMHRRALHRIPEPSCGENKTHAYLMDRLTALRPDAIEVMTGTGIRAVFSGRAGGKTLAFRADMDALPVTENPGCPFASEHPGYMHACGHDGHMANLLTFAEWLAANRGDYAGRAVLLFEPAEETIGGAQRMIAEGALKNPDVDAVYGLHMMPDVPKGRIASCAGPIMAQTCEMDITLRGKSAHGATPHLGVDTVAAMAHLITLIQTTLTRCVDPREQALVTIGRVRAGEQRNILAETAVLEGIARTFSNEVYEGLERRIRDDLRAVEAAFGVSAEFVRRVYYPCTCNDAAEFERVRNLLGDRFEQTQPRMIAEDFSYYQLEVPGVFAFCGCMDETHASPLHSASFGFDEASLVPGLALFIGLMRGNGRE